MHCAGTEGPYCMQQPEVVDTTTKLVPGSVVRPSAGHRQGSAVQTPIASVRRAERQLQWQHPHDHFIDLFSLISYIRLPLNLCSLLPNACTNPYFVSCLQRRWDSVSEELCELGSENKR